MYRELFTYPVFVATLLLIVHSWLYRGRRLTLLFWGLGYVIAFLREVVYQDVFPAPYILVSKGPRLWNIPVTIPMGWLFESYIALYVAQFILRTDRSVMIPAEGRITPRDYGTKVVPVIGLAAVIAGTIATAIEAAGLSMDWWIASGTDPLAYLKPGWQSGARYIDGHSATVQRLLMVLIFISHPALRVKRIFFYIAGIIAIEVSMIALEPAVRSGPWEQPVNVLMGLSVLGYFASVLMWKQLAIFVAAWFLQLNSVFPSEDVAKALGQSAEWARIDGVVWSTIVTLLYVFYLVRTQRPEPPVQPTQLL